MSVSGYPTLSSMGIQNPNQITGYVLSQPRADTDLLRIKYQRPKGSFLPVTRSYKIGRSQRMHVIDSGTNQTEMVYEISPMLSRAVAELDKIVNKHLSQKEILQQISIEVERMETDFLAEIASLRQLIEKLEKSA
ncbi:MAG: hypothetical protein CR991_10915 [Proteobacteria bacterium]|nr:MAG: hypothetical protein CR991_10915 [Pseudomonadota bacterium]